jgi:hypothetical protein
MHIHPSIVDESFTGIKLTKKQLKFALYLLKIIV